MVDIELPAGGTNTGGSIALIGSITLTIENSDPITVTPSQPTSSAAWS